MTSSNDFWQLLLDLPDRRIYYLADPRQSAAVFLLDDNDAGGVLINTPPKTQTNKIALKQFEIDYIFLPSHFGAHDLNFWRDTLNARTMADASEVTRIDGDIDIKIERKQKLTRKIYFILMSGRTQGTTALLCKNKPGVIFLGPALEHSSNGWPTLIQHENDASFENRLIGALGLQDVKFNYAFCDNFTLTQSQFGPDADRAIQNEFENIYN
jgi:hypothetical protein